nr:MAG TPA: hypothetical protein [Caudoviricetes sp.]
MVGSESLEPVLSIYISPDIRYSPSVVGTLSSGEFFNVSNAGKTTFKFSEILLTANISIRYSEDAQLSTSNLMSASPVYSGRANRAPAIMLELFRIRDWTQSASIVI